MTRAKTIPLPEPLRLRWQPLRVGLIELYHYDSEEFWFRDGHLLMRGNNGTGKSKVLSLTLPFLLDANLSAVRVEPDGDRGKRMDWNLLMGGRYERRTGYTWIEFGRRDENGRTLIFTLGCGLRAVAGRTQAEAWYFVTDQRIGADLWLTTTEHTAVTRERLSDAIGGRGQVFPTADAYRRAVDERLFQLGPERYVALIDTLIQLRQPQLSKQPNEQRLSDALTAALPPLEPTVIEDIAEAMNRLEDYRRELEEIETMRRSIAGFEQRYRRYAQIASRRRARSLRQAQTEFDSASRDLNAAEQQFTAAQEAVADWQHQQQGYDDRLRAAQAKLNVLRAHPVMRDAARIDEVRRQTGQDRDELAASERWLQSARTGFDREQQRTQTRQVERDRTRAMLSKQLPACHELAQRGGMANGHEHALRSAELPDGVDALVEQFPKQLQLAAREAEARRLEQIQVVKRRIAELAAAERERSLAVEIRRRCADALDSAQSSHDAAVAAHELAGKGLLNDWRRHLDELRVLRSADIQPAVNELETWVDSGDGANPARLALDHARLLQEQRLAALRAQHSRLRSDLDIDRTALQAEHARLLAGEDQAPPVPYTRGADARAVRTGAPLWQLVDFAAHVTEEAKAGIEAALEAMGLLDAWVSPEGVVIDAATHDVHLLARQTQRESLIDWLQPSMPDDVAPVVSVETVTAILRSIACSRDEIVDAEAWVSPDGQFRIGTVQGTWSKAAAAFIGSTARANARRRRLDEIGARIEELTVEIEKLDAALTQVAHTSEILRQEYERAPSDDSLLRAQAQLLVTAKVRREAQAQLAEAESQQAIADDARRRASEVLESDARDLQLPAVVDALDEYAALLTEYRHAMKDLADAIHQHRRALAEWREQQQRESTAFDSVEESTTLQAQRQRRLVDSEATLHALLASVGKQVEDLLADLAAVEKEHAQHDKDLNHARAQIIVVSTKRAAAEQKRTNLRERLSERSALRKQSIDALEQFAATALLSIALPDLSLPEQAGWGVEAALTAARRTEQLLVDVSAEESDWTRIQSEVSGHFTELQRAMSAQGHTAVIESTDHGLIVNIVYQQRSERPDTLSQRLESDLAERRTILSASEREVLENHLQQEVAANLQRLIQATERRVHDINRELHKRPTSTGVRYRLDWQPLPEDTEGAAAGLAEARKRLLRTTTDVWSTEDRQVVGEFLRTRITGERARDDSGTLQESLTRGLDYRRWHRFRVQRYQDGAWRPLSGPASSGERALGLTVPLFAAASSHYESAAQWAPRLVLLDEAFAGIDDEARANCMGLIREFDLDFLMTSEREWGCYPELPGLAICQLVRREGMDAVHVTRWAWDGRIRREEPDPERRFPQVATDDA